MVFFRFVSLLMFALIAGCHSVQPAFETTTKVISVDRDTVLVVRGDTAQLRVLLSCDSMNRFALKQIELLPGKKVRQVVDLQHNELTVTSIIDSEMVYMSWKERHVTTTTTQKEREIVEVKKEPPWWQKSLMGVGAFYLFVLMVVAIIRAFK